MSLSVRVPRDLAALFAQDAKRAGLSQSDWMAEILTSLYASSGSDYRPLAQERIRSLVAH